jgi:predicted transcriptional regulator
MPYDSRPEGAIRTEWYTGGGDTGALRAYRAHHPAAAIYTVTFRGRTVWMTSKQHAIWHEVQKYWKRAKRNVMQDIADTVGCSRATVSRFLRRLDLWRFIDLATIRGRNGGTYIFTRRPEPFKRWTMAMRQRVRNTLAARVKREALARLEPWLERYRQGGPKAAVPPPESWWKQARQRSLRLGSTGATFT